MLLLAVFAFALQGTFRFLNLIFIPLLLFMVAGLFYTLQPQLIHNTFTRLPWLPHICLVIACLISWQFGRSRLVWLGLLLFIAIQPIASHWVLGDALIQGRTHFVLLTLCWLMLSKDSGFSPRNLIFSVLTILTLGSIALWAIPVISNLPAFQHSILTPTTAWLFTLWPALYQWHTASELLFIMGTILVAIICTLQRNSTSHICLLLSCLSYILIINHYGNDVNNLVVSLLAIVITFAVIKDSFSMAFKDELTGVPSRRALMQKVQTLGRKYTVVMSDIDHFKKFNDTYGHDVGDEVLKLVASKLSKITGGGQAFRFGGEEFVLLFPNKTPAQVLPHVEAIRSVIADYDIALRTQPRPAKKPGTKPQKPPQNKIVKVTSSFGVAQRSKQQSAFEDVMKQADVALYAAKKAGRNCVKMAKQ